MERVAVLSVVSHETDTVECFVRHHAAAADRIILITRNPDAALLGILNGLRAEGLPVTIVRENGMVPFASSLMREMRAALQNADWILPLAPDEFLVLPPERSLPDILRQLPRDRVTLIPRRIYIPTPEDNAYAPTVLRRIIHRRSSEDGRSAASLIPAMCVKEEVVLEEESRMLLDGQGKPVETLRSAVLAVAHFPIRSSEQLTTRVLSSIIDDAATEGGGSRVWKHLFDRCSRGQAWSAAELRNIALRYGLPDGIGMVPGLIRDPVLTEVTTLRYGQNHGHPLEALSRAALALAGELAVQASRKQPATGGTGAMAGILMKLEESVHAIAAELAPLLKIAAEPDAHDSSREAALVLVLGMFAAHVRSPVGIEHTALGARMALAARMPTLPPRWTVLHEILMRPKLPSTLEVALKDLTTTLSGMDLPRCMAECRTAQGNEDCFSAVLCALGECLEPGHGRHVTPAVAAFAAQAVNAIVNDEFHVEEGLAGKNVVIADPMPGTGDLLREILRRFVIAAIRRGTNAMALHEELKVRLGAEDVSSLHHLHASVLLEHYDMRFPPGASIAPASGLPKGAAVRVLCTRLPFGEETGSSMAMKKDEQSIFEEYTRVLQKYGTDGDLLRSGMLQALAAVHARLEASEQGVGAVVAPRILLHASALRDVRRHVTESFEQLWVLDLHGAGEDGEDEKLPGSDASGLCILILVRGRKVAQHALYCGLKGLRLEKMHALFSRAFRDLPWRRIGPEHPMYLFLPR